MKSWKEHYWYTVPVSRARIEEIVRRVIGLDEKTGIFSQALADFKILDVGCNEGFLSQALIEQGCRVTSVDIDDAMIKKAKELFNIDAIKADVNALPFEDYSFDLVIGGELLEHIDNPGKALSEMFRVSKKKVIISLPIGEYWLGCQDHKWLIDSCVIEHDQGTKEKLIKKILVLEFKKRPM